MIVYSENYEVKNPLYFGGVYLHGNAETMIGYDIVCTTSKKLNRLCERRKHFSRRVYDVLLYNHKDKKNYRCKLYIWSAEWSKDLFMTKGLICLANDKWANKNAREKFNAEKAYI